ncbi:hypothetical protein EDC01DRAFT_728812, partial [Geopyxis carbonaria]
GKVSLSFSPCVHILPSRRPTSLPRPPRHRQPRKCSSGFPPSKSSPAPYSKPCPSAAQRCSWTYRQPFPSSVCLPPHLQNSASWTSRQHHRLPPHPCRPLPPLAGLRAHPQRRAAAAATVRADHSRRYRPSPNTVLRWAALHARPALRVLARAAPTAAATARAVTAALLAAVVAPAADCWRWAPTPRARRGVPRCTSRRVLALLLRHRLPRGVAVELADAALVWPLQLAVARD